MPDWNITSEGLANLANQILEGDIAVSEDSSIKAEAYPSDFNGYISIHYDGDNQIGVTHVADDFVPRTLIDTGVRYSKVVDSVREMDPETLEAEIKGKIKDVYDFVRTNS